MQLPLFRELQLIAAGARLKSPAVLKNGLRMVGLLYISFLSAVNTLKLVF